LGWLDPQPTENEYLALYRKEYYEGNLWGGRSYEYLAQERKRFFSQRLQEIARYLRDNKLNAKIIDIGAGTGDFIRSALEMGFQAYGYEISSFAREKAIEKYGLELWGPDISELAIEPESVDVIHMNHVLEHLTKPRQMLDLFNKWLKPRGLMVVEVPHQMRNLLDIINYYYRRGSRTFGLLSLHHAYFYTPWSLRILLQQHLFRIEKIRTYYPYMQLYTTNRAKRLIKKGIFFFGGLINRGFIIEAFVSKS